MKKSAIIAVLLVLLTMQCFAADDKAAVTEGNKTVSSKQESTIDTSSIGFQKTPINKLVRGLINTVTFLCEIPASIWDVSEKRNPIAGFTVGTVEGMFTSAIRLGTGLWDTCTFFASPYDKPLMTPEYAFESAAEKMSQ